MAKPTRSMADELVDQAKIITSTVRWIPERPKAWRLNVRVVSKIDPSLAFSLRGYVGRRNYSFTLLYHNYVLRKFTRHAPHKIGGQVFTEAHKHVWDGKTENREAYIPDDIDPDDDLNDQFLSFCRECNIELAGGYQRAAFIAEGGRS